jgi:hypothetical protein
MAKEFTIQEFKARFKDEASCLEFLISEKWGFGYKCSKCVHSEFSKGRQWFYRRCKSCKFDESATSGTLFHGAKMSLVKIFELAFRISQRKKGM